MKTLPVVNQGETKTARQLLEESSGEDILVEKLFSMADPPVEDVKLAKLQEFIDISKKITAFQQNGGSKEEYDSLLDQGDLLLKDIFSHLEFIHPEPKHDGDILDVLMSIFDRQKVPVFKIGGGVEVTIMCECGKPGVCKPVSIRRV